MLAFDDMITKENLYRAWNDFIRGKRKRPDVNELELRLCDNIGDLYAVLLTGSYRHSSYEEYMILDPKKRVIHKASVRDRIVHRLLYNALCSHFDTRFVYDSYSCRIGKGTHRARERFRVCANKVSKNYSKSCYVLKFDIKKCFATIDQNILRNLLHRHSMDTKLYSLLEIVITSFGEGIPLGNLTSQLFINIYLHELDHFAKHTLGVKNYIRYADDVVILHSSPAHLEEVFGQINFFLQNTLRLTTHKVQIPSLYSGVDVLGEVFFAEYKRLRRNTERRAKLRARAQKLL